ncbi:protein kinase domain-containing protein [Massilia sp. PWRC2]|uniref:class III lanthionine synthetase LanKC N-terminal domain-containing protein n=1 Tax=Massilia sp. PWRC2 TaxID=2804626 RepID=UPI003CE75454
MADIAVLEHFGTLDKAWLEAVDRYLPVRHPPWCFNREIGADLPGQGWKLHVSATILTATEVLDRVGQCLAGESVYFKAIETRDELRKLNCGLFYGYFQIGKFMTIYPTDASAVGRIAHKVATATAGMAGPPVPFELRVEAGSPVFMRYGMFRPGSGDGAASLINPDGLPEPDRRDRNPDWAALPVGLPTARPDRVDGPLARRFRVYKCLSQRGKGGVYQAIDVACGMRHCILKEGRRHGEVDLDGSDGWSRLDSEYHALCRLSQAGVPVPAPIARFEQAGHAYVVMEWLHGEVLGKLLMDSADLPSTDMARDLARRSAGLLKQIHAARWAWRDLKSTNLIIGVDGALRPIDFEGSARFGTPLDTVWGSPGHMPHDVHLTRTAGPEQDLFALGSLLYQIFTGKFLADARGAPAKCDVSGLPEPIIRLMNALWHADPRCRPAAAAVCEALAVI